MATIGLKFPVFGKYTEDEENRTTSYADGKIMGRAIRLSYTLNIAEAPLYADDGIAESVREFTGGTLSVNPDDLDGDVGSDLYGQTVKTVTVDTEEVEEYVSNESDTSTYVGVGAYATKVRGGKKLFRALFFHKVQFSPPNDTFETKGSSVNWQTPTIEGTIMRDVKGDWKSEITVESEELARAWLKQKVAMN